MAEVVGASLYTGAAVHMNHSGVTFTTDVLGLNVCCYILACCAAVIATSAESTQLEVHSFLKLGETWFLECDSGAHGLNCWAWQWGRTSVW